MTLSKPSKTQQAPPHGTRPAPASRCCRQTVVRRLLLYGKPSIPPRFFRYLDGLPTTGDASGRAFRDVEWEAKVLKICQEMGIGAQFGGKYFCHDVRVIRVRIASTSPLRLLEPGFPRAVPCGCWWSFFCGWNDACFACCLKGEPAFVSAAFGKMLNAPIWRSVRFLE